MIATNQDVDMLLGWIDKLCLAGFNLYLQIASKPQRNHIIYVVATLRFSKILKVKKSKYLISY